MLFNFIHRLLSRKNTKALESEFEPYKVFHMDDKSLMWFNRKNGSVIGYKAVKPNVGDYMLEVRGSVKNYYRFSSVRIIDTDMTGKRFRATVIYNRTV